MLVHFCYHPGTRHGYEQTDPRYTELTELLPLFAKVEEPRPDKEGLENEQ